MDINLLLSVSCLLLLSGATGKYHYNLHKSQSSPQHPSTGKPMGRHKNHCAYVVEKTITFTMQDGMGPYIKAEYNKCGAWGPRCPTIIYRLMYKPKYKVAYKTLTELEWRCCPGFSGFGCKISSMHKGPMPMHKGPMPMHKGPMPMHKGHMPMHKGPMPIHKGPMPMHKGPMPMYKGPMPMHKGPVPMHKGPMPMQKGPMVMQKGPMPPFKGPMPPFKGPMPPFKGSMPPFHGMMQQPSDVGHQWGQNPSGMRPLDNFGQHGDSYNPPAFPPNSNSHPFIGHPEGAPDHHDPSPDQHDPSLDHHDPSLDLHDPNLDPNHHEPTLNHHDSSIDHSPELDHHHPSAGHLSSIPDQEAHAESHPIRMNVEAELIPEETEPAVDSHPNYDHDLDGVTAERLDRMEEDVQRLSLGLETLRGTVTGLEDSLRASLREDANRMLSALLSAAPAATAAGGPHLVLGSSDSTVGFGDLPGVAPDTMGLDGSVAQLPGLGDLSVQVASLRNELRAKVSELEDLRGTVLGHEGTLNRLTNGTSMQQTAPDTLKAMETMVDAKLGDTRAAILGGFERRVESAESRCEGKSGEVRRKCLRDLLDGQTQLEDNLEGSVANLRRKMADLQAQLHTLSQDNDCCYGASGLAERVALLEQSMDTLNQSQKHLKAELGGHKDHIEGMLEGRLGYVEARLNITMDKPRGGSRVGAQKAWESKLDERLKDLEERLFAAVEELSNATAPALLEGQVVPTLETEVESLRRRMAVDVDRVQRHLANLELMCSSSCASGSHLEGNANLQFPEDNATQADAPTNTLDEQTERLNRLNATLGLILRRLAEREEGQTGGLQGEVTLLKFSVHSVNRTLLGLRDSLGVVVQEVQRANFTWQDREERLAQQVKGVVQLVGKQASMLSSGERRLTRLKGELQELRRRLAGELQSCRSTALGVQKEVTEVGGRVARVEGQCGGLSHLADDLERIRAELEGHSEGYLAQLNSTLTSHSMQLLKLREDLKNCTASTGLALADLNTVPTHATPEEQIEVAAEPRGDQFAVPSRPTTLL